MTRGPVLHQQKQISHVLRPNYNAVQWPRINMTYRASRRRYQSSVRPRWRGRRGHLHWTHRGIPFRLAEKYTSSWGSYISPHYDWKRGLLRRRQTKQKMTDGRYEAASVLTTVTSQVKGLPPCQGINIRLLLLLFMLLLLCIALLFDFIRHCCGE